MRVTVDNRICQGHAVCNMLEPDLFPLDDNGYSALLDTHIEAGDFERVRRVVASCPERALSVTEP
jgi:ferredoxin